MNAITKILATTVSSLPLLAFAQTPPPVAAPEKPTAGMQRTQQTETGQAPKYGAPATTTGAAMSHADDEMSKSGTRHKTMKSDKTKMAPPVGDLPKYPAPSRDGTPTK